MNTCPNWQEICVPVLTEVLAYPSGAPECTLVFNGVHVTRSLLMCMLCRSLFVLCPFSVDHCVVCSTNYGF